MELSFAVCWLKTLRRSQSQRVGDSIGMWMGNRHKDVKVTSDRHNQQHNDIVWFSAKQALHAFTKKHRITEYWNAPDCPCQIWLCAPYVYCPILSNIVSQYVLWALLLIWLIVSCLDLRKFFCYNTHDSQKCNEDITDKTVTAQACSQPCREVCSVSSRGMPHRGRLHSFQHKLQTKKWWQT